MILKSNSVPRHIFIADHPIHTFRLYWCSFLMRMTMTIIRLWKYRDKRTNKTLPFDKFRHHQIFRFCAKYAFLLKLLESGQRFHKRIHDWLLVFFVAKIINETGYTLPLFCNIFEYARVLAKEWAICFGVTGMFEFSFVLWQTIYGCY